MKTKLGWILFSIMTVAVIVLSSVLIFHNARWKSGDELLDINKEDIDSIKILACNGAQPWQLIFLRNSKILSLKEITNLMTEARL
jgi:hypothetical protein